MKRLMLSTSILALLLSSAAIAAPGNGNDKQQKQGQGHSDQKYGDQQNGNNPKAKGQHDNGLHLGQQKQAWKRGQRLPQTYLVERYYIDDYRHYNLAPPPVGYRYVRPYQDDNEYLLVQVATGIISEIFGN